MREGAGRGRLARASPRWGLARDRRLRIRLRAMTQMMRAAKRSGIAYSDGA
jgi:hypothetical protein